MEMCSVLWKATTLDNPHCFRGVLMVRPAVVSVSIRYAGCFSGNANILPRTFFTQYVPLACWYPISSYEWLGKIWRAWSGRMVQKRLCCCKRWCSWSLQFRRRHTGIRNSSRCIYHKTTVVALTQSKIRRVVTAMIRLNGLLLNHGATDLSHSRGTPGSSQPNGSLPSAFNQPLVDWFYLGS